MSRKPKKAKNRLETISTITFIVAIILLLGVIGVVIMAFLVKPSQTTHESKTVSSDITKTIKINAEEAIVNVMDDYIELHWKKDVFWYLQSESDLEAKRQEILGIISRNRNLSDITRSIFAIRNKIRVSMYGSLDCQIDLSRFGNRTADDGLEISFMPQAVVIGQDQTKNHYRGDWRAIMLLAVDWPTIDYAGLVMHELGHAIDHFEGREGAIPQNGESEEHIGAEVKHHSLEARVVNRETNGQYFDLFRNIISRRMVSNWKEAIALMTLADFQELDRITGAEGCGFLVADALATSYPRALGFYWVDEQHIQNPMKEKIEIYRWTHTIGLRSRLIKK